MRGYTIPGLPTLFACLLLTTSALGDDAKYQLKVATDRPDAIYDAGERARFIVTLTKGDQPVTEGTVSYIVDDFITDRPEKSDQPRGELQIGEQAEIEVHVPNPGFLRCQVSYRSPDKQTFKAIAGAGFSPAKIGLSLAVPDDFDEFWDAQKAELAELPAAAKLTPLEYKVLDVDCFDVQVPCIGGAPVSGYFARPMNAKHKSLPAILWVHGAGVRGSSVGNAVKGGVAGMLSMDINAHGIPNGQPPAFYQELSAGRLKNYRYEGREDREQSYFRGMFLRLVRAIDFLTNQPEWDGETVVVIGHSQGGGQALAAGGLDDRVTLVAAGVPAICDHSGRVAGRINGWPKLVPLDTDGTPNATILQASRYFDSVNHASRCRAEAIMSVGFIDVTCPPSSCYAAYNQLLGKKQMINEPLMSHAAPKHIHDAFFKTVKEHVRRQQALNQKSGQ